MIELRGCLVTRELVFEAAEALVAELGGKSPSVRRVRERLGGGSPNAITEFLREWRDTQVAIRSAATIQVDDATLRAIETQLKAVSEAARADLQERLRMAEADIEELTAVGRELETRVAGLTAEFAAAKDELQQRCGEIRQLTADVEKTSALAAEEVAIARDAIEHERRAAEAAKVELGRMEVRLEKMAEVGRECAGLRTALEHERKLRTDAERMAAVEQAHALGLAARLADTQQRLDVGATVPTQTTSVGGLVPASASDSGMPPRASAIIRIDP